MGIDPQVTSLVLGAAYVAGAYFFIRVVMVDSWHRVAAGFPAVIVFVWGAAGATALHLDRFMHDGLSFAAWAAIYAIAPARAAAALSRPAARGARAVRRHADVSRARILLGGVGGAVVLGALLAFALPQITIDVWPWTLTPLTARIVATVMALFGSLWVSVALHGGKTAARIPLEAHALGLAFLLIAAVRGSGDIDWTNPLAAVLVAGVAAWRSPTSCTLARLRPISGGRVQGVPGWLRGSGEPRLDAMVWPDRHRTAAQPRAHHGPRPVRAGPERALGAAQRTHLSQAGPQLRHWPGCGFDRLRPLSVWRPGRGTGITPCKPPSATFSCHGRTARSCAPRATRATSTSTSCASRMTRR